MEGRIRGRHLSFLLLGFALGVGATYFIFIPLMAYKPKSPKDGPAPITSNGSAPRELVEVYERRLEALGYPKGEAALAVQVAPRVSTFVSRSAEPFRILVEKAAEWDANAVSGKVTGLLQATRAGLRDLLPSLRAAVMADRLNPVIYLRRVPKELREQEFLDAFARADCLVLSDSLEPSLNRKLIALHLLRRWSPSFQRAHDEMPWFTSAVLEQAGAAFRDHSQSDEAMRLDFDAVPAARWSSAAPFAGDQELVKLERLVELRNDAPLLEDDHERKQMRIAGSMLMHFLRSFDANENGLVRIPTTTRSQKGRYAGVWERLAETALNGGALLQGGEAFSEAVQVAGAGDLQVLSKEFDSYRKWVMRKIRLEQWKEGRLISWDQARNQRGELTGQITDDLLK